MQGGWGKVNAAASTQFAINTWNPRIVTDLDTCIGFKGDRQGKKILDNETIIYGKWGASMSTFGIFQQ